MASYYGATVDWTPEFVYFVKPLGAFMFVLGVLAVVAARDPVGNRWVVYGFVVLFTIRGLQRIVFQEEIANAFAISGGRNIGNAIFFLALGASLFFLHRAATKGAGSTT
jgi:hypothetical protein